MFNRVEYKYKAKKAMKGRILNFLMLFFVMTLIATAISLADSVWIGISTMATILVLPVLSVGVFRYCRNCYHDEESYSDLFFAFKRERYVYTVKVMLILILKIFVWTCLLIIPGIIKAYEYSMIPWILTEDKMYDTREIFRKTKGYTNGHKIDLFVLELSFIGWGLLAVLTCGLLSFYVVFYQTLTTTAFYLETTEGDNKDVVVTETSEE